MSDWILNMSLAYLYIDRREQILRLDISPICPLYIEDKACINNKLYFDKKWNTLLQIPKADLSLHLFQPVSKAYLQ